MMQNMCYQQEQDELCQYNSIKRSLPQFQLRASAKVSRLCVTAQALLTSNKAAASASCMDSEPCSPKPGQRLNCSFSFGSVQCVKSSPSSIPSSSSSGSSSAVRPVDNNKGCDVSKILESALLKREKLVGNRQSGNKQKNCASTGKQKQKLNLSISTTF